MVSPGVKMEESHFLIWKINEHIRKWEYYFHLELNEGVCDKYKAL